MDSFSSRVNVMKIVVVLVTLATAVRASSNEWDHFVFAQSWPPGTCADAKRESHTCHVDQNVTTWIVHGLWPSLGDTKGPTSCASLPFDFTQLKPLQAKLHKFWPNLFNDTSADSFWCHEWSKHGTCCQDLPATTGEYKYFNQAIELNQKYNVLEILQASSVTPDPSTQYNYTDLLDAISKVTGFKPIMQCTAMTMSDGSTYHLIQQIQICLNKDFTPRTCDVQYEEYLLKYYPQTSCPKKKNVIHYPPIKHM